jgi:hypothetical protein
VTVGSVVGAPGATTTALALVRSRTQPAVLLETDPDGGRLTSWVRVEHRPGTVELLAAARGLETGDALHWVQRPDPASAAHLVVAHPSGELVDRALRSNADDLARLAVGAPFDVVCDVGRYRPDCPTWPLCTAAAWRVVVTRGDLADLAVVSHTVMRLRELGPVLVVVTGDGSYGAGEIANALDVPAVGLPPIGTPVPSRRFLRAIDELNLRLWTEGEP